MSEFLYFRNSISALGYKNNCFSLSSSVAGLCKISSLHPLKISCVAKCESSRDGLNSSR